MVLYITSLLLLTATLKGIHFSRLWWRNINTYRVSASQVAQLVQSISCVHQQHRVCGNIAYSGGAMAVLPCMGTEVYINGSKFYNNVADGGGHM